MSVFQNELAREPSRQKAKVERVRYRYDVFISFSSLDQEHAVEIYNAIKKSGKTAFLSATDLTPGQDFADEIRKQLVASRGPLANCKSK